MRYDLYIGENATPGPTDWDTDVNAEYVVDAIQNALDAAVVRPDEPLHIVITSAEH